jgi:hypothetical protein
MPVITTAFWEKAKKLPHPHPLSPSLKVLYFRGIKIQINEMKPKM